MSQVTALIDGNNFYASCEQSIDPALEGKPLVVLSNNDGCIVARSAEARALGISMGTPYFKVRDKCNQLGVEVRSSNYALYGDMSERLMKVLQGSCEELEVYSIDEAFVRISNPYSFKSRVWARQLRAQVRRSLGLTIAIGLGKNKVQAKLANHLAKSMPEHAGVFNLITTHKPDYWLEAIAIEDVWGVGRVFAQWCRLRGIKTARQLRDMPSEELQSTFGVIGVRLQHELRGEICLPFNQTQLPKKETCVSQSFRRPITNLKELRQAIATYIVRASEKLRHQKQYTSSITIFTRTNPFLSPFYSQAASTSLDQPSNNTAKLLAASLPLTEEIFQPHYPLVKAGVIMKHLQSTSYLQQNLLINYEAKKIEQRNEKLMETIDKLNHRYGHGTISWAICGLTPNWTMRRDLLSQASTTRLDYVPTVEA